MGGYKRKCKSRPAAESEVPADALLVLLTSKDSAVDQDTLQGCPSTVVPASHEQQQQHEATGGAKQQQLQLASWSHLPDLVSWYCKSILPTDKSAKLIFATSLPKECRADVHTLVSKKYKDCCESMSEGFGDERCVAIQAKGAAGRTRRVPQEQADHALALWLLYKEQRKQQLRQQQQQHAGQPSGTNGDQLQQQATDAAGRQQQQQQQDCQEQSILQQQQVVGSSADVELNIEGLQLDKCTGQDPNSDLPAELAATAPAQHQHQQREYSRDEVAQMLAQNKLPDELAALWHGPAGVAQRWSREICLAAAAGELEEVQALIESQPGLLSQNILDLSSGGQLPLHLAAASGAVDVLRLLIDCGADVGAKNGSGETALQVAQRCEQCDCEAILLQAGAINTQTDSWQNFKGEL